jgi:hypothetical protein
VGYSRVSGNRSLPLGRVAILSDLSVGHLFSSGPLQRIDPDAALGYSFFAHSWQNGGGMDLHTLEERTGLALRSLRYVLDHRLVPGLNIQLASKVAGRPRRFSDDAGFGIACAAVLLQAGVQRKRVHQFLKDLLATVGSL